MKGLFHFLSWGEGNIIAGHRRKDIMVLTTTNSIQGWDVTEYTGIVFGEVISGVNFLRDIGSSFRDIFGGRSRGYEEELAYARQQALDEMAGRAANMGADAVIGVKMDYEVLGETNGMLMVSCSGTAVRLRQRM